MAVSLVQPPDVLTGDLLVWDLPAGTPPPRVGAVLQWSGREPDTDEWRSLWWMYADRSGTPSAPEPTMALRGLGVCPGEIPRG